MSQLAEATGVEAGKWQCQPPMQGGAEENGQDLAPSNCICRGQMPQKQQHADCTTSITILSTGFLARGTPVHPAGRPGQLVAPQGHADARNSGWWITVFEGGLRCATVTPPATLLAITILHHPAKRTGTIPATAPAPTPRSRSDLPRIGHHPDRRRSSAGRLKGTKKRRCCSKDKCETSAKST